jgi:hypothetical protein
MQNFVEAIRENHPPEEDGNESLRNDSWLLKADETVPLGKNKENISGSMQWQRSFVWRMHIAFD